MITFDICFPTTQVAQNLDQSIKSYVQLFCHLLFLAIHQGWITAQVVQTVDPILHPKICEILTKDIKGHPLSCGKPMYSFEVLA